MLHAWKARAQDKPTEWGALPKKLRVLIVVLTIFAIPVVLWSVWDIAHHSRSNDWIVLAILNTLTVPFLVALPSASMLVQVGDVYMMALAMVYGPSPCVVATVFNSLAACTFVLNRPRVIYHETVFNVCSMVCAAFVYSNAYKLANPTHLNEIPDTILPASALTLTFFLFNSLITATAVSWASGEGSLRFWTRECPSMAPDFVISAAGAILIVALHKVNPAVPLAVAPLIGVVWARNKAKQARLARQLNK